MPSPLCLSSACFALPLLEHLNNVARDICYDETTVPLQEYVLAALLFATIGTSQWFWSNPVKGSPQHKIDGIIAKLTICGFIMYTILCKEPPVIYYLWLFMFLTTAFASHYYSSQDWCSWKHIITHGSLHLICVCAAWYGFVRIAQKE
jgi:hypothetical protein